MVKRSVADESIAEVQYSDPAGEPEATSVSVGARAARTLLRSSKMADSEEFRLRRLKVS